MRWHHATFKNDHIFFFIFNFWLSSSKEDCIKSEDPIDTTFLPQNWVIKTLVETVNRNCDPMVVLTLVLQWMLEYELLFYYISLLLSASLTATFCFSFLHGLVDSPTLRSMRRPCEATLHALLYLYVFNMPAWSYLSDRGTAVPVRCFLLAAEYPGSRDEFFTGPPFNSFCLPASLPHPPFSDPRSTGSLSLTHFPVEVFRAH